MSFTSPRSKRVRFMPRKEPDQLTRQEPAGQADINEIVRRARAGQNPSWLNHRTPVFADVSELPKDLTEAYVQVQRAEEAFAQLPAKFRAAIDNDPRKLFSAPKELFEEHGLTLTPDEPLDAVSEPAKGAPKGAKAPGASRPGGSSKSPKETSPDDSSQD